MKKFLSILFLFSIFVFGSIAANGMTYDEAMAQTKPVAVLIYADWADDVQQVMQVYNAKGQDYSDKYNFVTMNIASPETKSFNKTFHIYPNLPYVLLFREKGKISRYLNKDCVLKDSCFTEKLNFFVN